MVTDGRTAMPTEQSILTLSQWISPRILLDPSHIVTVLRLL